MKATLIPCSDTASPLVSWQQCLADVIREPEQLFRLLELDIERLPASLAGAADFELRVPLPFVERMEKGDWDDPLLRQVLPSRSELQRQPGYVADPLAEQASNPLPGLIHKYHGRVLLLVSAGCGINCRYCFRRHFPYGENNRFAGRWLEVLDYIRAEPAISEVIFSGGDPLVAGDRLLARLVAELAEIPHVQRLRVHSRLPVVVPQRVTDELLGWMTQSRLRPVMVIHANHPRELDSAVAASMARLRQAGVTVLNQSVLLAGVNDNLAALSALSERLFEIGVMPYYLHLLDRVQGAAHFAVDDTRARRLLGELSSRLPGYLVPKLARERGGDTAKRVLAPLF